MKFAKNAKIDRVVSAETSRYAIHGVYLDVAKSSLVATNGRSLASIPCEVEEGDVSGIIPVEAVKLAGKGRGDTGRICVNGNVRVLDAKGVETTMAKIEGNFPDYARLMQDNSGAEHRIRLAIDVKILLDLAAAMGTTKVVLDFVGKPFSDDSDAVELRANWPINVTPTGPDCITGASGIIMPIAVSD